MGGVDVDIGVSQLFLMNKLPSREWPRLSHNPLSLQARDPGCASNFMQPNAWCGRYARGPSGIASDATQLPPFPE